MATSSMLENAMFMASWMGRFLEARQIRSSKKSRLFEQDEFHTSIPKWRPPPEAMLPTVPQLTGHETQPETSTFVGHSYQSRDVGKVWPVPLSRSQRKTER